MIRNIDEWLRPDLAVTVRNMAPNVYESLFDTSLRARILWSLSRFACDPGSADYVYLNDEALSEAAYAGVVAVYDHDDAVIVPALLDDVPELRSAFIERAEETRTMIEEAERECEEKQRQKAESERINKLIVANAWAELHLPTPEELTAKLASGELVTIECHSVSYDSADNMTWYTNPYGIDGVLFNGLPTLAGVRRFLTDMARGVDYGPTPD